MNMVETVEITVKRGETLKTLVARAGFPARDWLRIYNAGYNRKLRKLRPDPEAVQPGDRLLLPRYTPQDLDGALLQFTSALVRLDRVGKASGALANELVVLRKPRPGKPSGLSHLQKAALQLEKLASEAGRDCAEGFSALGSSSRRVTLDFRPLAHDLSRMARKLDPKAEPGGKDMARALKALSAVLDRLRRSHDAVQAEIQKHSTNLRAMSRAIY